MAVAFGSASINAEHTSPNTVYTAPTGIADGDWLVIYQFLYKTSGAVSFVAGDATPPTGFSAAPGTWPSVYDLSTTVHCGQYCWIKKAASESGNYTVTHASLPAARGIMFRVSGADPTTPFSPNPTQNVGSATATTTFLGLTTTVAGELIVVIQSDDNDGGASLTAPTGSTPTFTIGANDAGGNFMAYGTLASAAATGNKTMTNNSSGGAFAFFSTMMAFQPPGGGGGGVTPIPGSVASQAVNRSLTY